MGCIYFEPVLNDFLFKSVVSKPLWSRISNNYSITISKSETKKGHNIIISRVISRHMGPMYVETPYISHIYKYK